MNRDELTALAKEAGIVTAHNTEHLTIAGIERFAALVAAKEREACAKVCDVIHQHHIDTYGKYIEETYASECAATIRARKP